MELVKPIFLIGTGRSGSSMLHRLLARHPELSWLSGLCNRYPRKPQYNRWMMHAIDFPMLGSLLLRRYQPNESYRFWQEHSRGFDRPFRDLVAADVTEREKREVRKALAASVTSSRSRLLIKITGWPRIGYLAELFPDAKFVHLVRDGRAVANSLLAVSFWDGWRGPGRWRWDDLDGGQRDAWMSYDRSFVALAGFEWTMMLAALEKASQTLPPSQLLEIRYEELCTDKIETIKQIVHFSELAWTAGFARDVDRFPTISANEKWRTDLSDEQQRILQEVELPYLEKYGYTSSPTNR